MIDKCSHKITYTRLTGLRGLLYLPSEKLEKKKISGKAATCDATREHGAHGGGDDQPGRGTGKTTCQARHKRPGVSHVTPP